MLFDNLFLIAGPMGTATMLFTLLFLVGGAFSMGHKIQRPS
jgi:hypothetical protein